MLVDPTEVKTCQTKLSRQPLGLSKNTQLSVEYDTIINYFNAVNVQRADPDQKRT